MKKISNSPMTIEFWVKRKGYTEEDAKQKIKTFRKCNVEYWISRGYTEEDAKKEVKIFNKQSVDKGKEKIKKKRKENPEKYSNNIEYWLKKTNGNLEKSKILLSERQTTFSKEKCIKKYGEVKGLQIWKDRQNKWQNTLNNKTDDEIKNINKKKASGYDGLMKKYGNKKNVREILIKKGSKIYKNLDEFKTELLNKLYNSGYYYLTLEQFINTTYFKRLHLNFKYFEIKNIKKFLKKLYNFRKNEIIFINNCKYRSFYMLINKKILRSSSEIYFYKLCNDNNVKYEIEKRYDNSRMRCDFYLSDYNLYIEICGNMDNKEYREKMLYKQKTFKSILLINENEYKIFFEMLIKGENVESYFKRN